MKAPSALEQWVVGARDRREMEFRQAVHTLLAAVYAANGGMAGAPVLKGGVLLALRYGSERFTRDVDFSTTRRQGDLKPETLVAELAARLEMVVQELPYGLACRVQRYELRPPSPSSTFPTLQVSIGYAPVQDSPRFQRLQRGRAADVIQLDYSYNEVVTGVDLDMVDGGATIRLSSLVDLVAEKYRALLQQQERNRERYQDSWDIHWLLHCRPELDSAMKREEVLRALYLKCHDRVEISRASMESEQLRTRAARRYPELEQLVRGTLPPFDDLWLAVKRYYESLPW